MEDKNLALINECNTLRDMCDQLLGTAYRLTPDKADVNAATVRSLYTIAGALASEINNLNRLLDSYND